MNILMMSNTYTPFVGGVEKSIEQFSTELRKRGHRVVVVAPSFADAPRHEPEVLRVPAIQRFNGTDFSLQLPVPGVLHSLFKQFAPDIVHSHHPYLVGDTAIRIAAMRNIPIVFTFHTFYERYTHYVPLNSDALKRFVAALAIGYGNLCDMVIAPSQSVAQTIRLRGLSAPVVVIPTGVIKEHFAQGEGSRFRQRYGIARTAYVVGLVSRLAPEKNILYLASAVASFMLGRTEVYFVAVGQGSCAEGIRSIFAQHSLLGRLCMPGTLQNEELVDAYKAMDCFVFASQSETQGMVLTEALAAGLPVVALRGPGVSDVIRDGYNGRCIDSDSSPASFVRALAEVQMLSPKQRELWRSHSAETVGELSNQRCVSRLEEVYGHVRVERSLGGGRGERSLWEQTRELVKTEMQLLGNIFTATGTALDTTMQQRASDE
jgi:glycosyltransferase involved in cell wall biosynthesis